MAGRSVVRLVRDHSDSEAGRYEKLYWMVLDAIPSSVLLVDRQMRVVSANRNFLDRARRAESETIGHRIDAVFPPVIVEQMDLAARIHAAFEGNVPTKGERMVYRAPGLATRIYYYSLIPFSWRGAIEVVMLLLEDVTDQMKLGEEARRAERHLASVVESASDIVLSTSTDGRLMTWNASAEKISGYTAQEVQGRMFFELCAQSHQASTREAFARARRGERFDIAEWDLITKAGTPVPLSWVGSAMRDDQGRVIAIVAVGRDLTERRKFEVHLLHSQKLAALGVLAGGIAHEVRNPLSISSSAAQFLLEEPDDPEFRRQCATKILAGIRRACLIIENLLHFARLGAQPAMVRLDLVSQIRDAAALAGPQAGVQRVKVELDLLDHPVFVSGVPGLLQQVFMNLFLNALAAMPSGGSLRVSLEEANDEGRIQITDTGCGMASPDIEKIFDPFYTTKPSGKGTGLGLSICYSIVRQHFGVIEVESREGQGSTFIVRLPLLKNA